MSTEDAPMHDMPFAHPHQTTGGEVVICPECGQRLDPDQLGAHWEAEHAEGGR